MSNTSRTVSFRPNRRRALPLGRTEQDPEPRAADVVERRAIDDHLPRAGREHPVECLLGLRRCVAVETPREHDEGDAVLRACGDVHGPSSHQELRQADDVAIGPAVIGDVVHHPPG